MPTMADTDPSIDQQTATTRLTTEFNDTFQQGDRRTVPALFHPPMSCGDTCPHIPGQRYLTGTYPTQHANHMSDTTTSAARKTPQLPSNPMERREPWAAHHLAIGV